MKDDSAEFGGDLIDVRGMSLRDVEGLPETSLVCALREVMTNEGTGPFVAGFSARVLNMRFRASGGDLSRGIGTSWNVGVSSGTRGQSGRRLGWCWMDDADWNRLIAQLLKGDCTPFLGAGACYGTLPNASEMSRSWASRYGYPFEDEQDLPRVMQYISVIDGDPVSIKEMVCDEFSRRDPPPFGRPAEPHSVLANFPIRVFITTNYDNFLSKALVWAGKTPRQAICPWYQSASADPSKAFARLSPVRPESEKPLVFHLHGCLDKPKSLVLTDGDYLEFLANIAFSRTGEGTTLVPSVVLSAMTDYPLLFIGYSLQDWTFRVLFHSLLRAQSDVLRRRSLSVQLLPPVSTSVVDAEKRAQEYIGRYLGGWKISIFWGTAEEFCSELVRRMEVPM